MFALFFILAFSSYFFLGEGYAGDQLSFLWEREFYSSYLDFFIHVLSFDRTRHTILPNSLLFRPGVFAYLAIEDIFLRTWPAVQVLIRILIHSLNAFILFRILKIMKLSQVAALFFAVLFIIRFPSSKLVNEINFGPYLFVILFSGLGLLWFLEKKELWKVSICFLLAAFFHEFVAVGIIVLCGLSFINKKMFAYRKYLLTITLIYLSLNILSFISYPIKLDMPPRSYLNIFNSGIVHTFYLLGRYVLTFFIPQIFNLSTSLSYLLYLPVALGFLYFVYKNKKSEPILFLSVLFFVSSAFIVGFGRGGLGSLSYLQSAFWNEYFAGFFIIIILAGIFKKYLNSIPVYGWVIFIVFNAYSSLFFIEKLKTIPLGIVERITWDLKNNNQCLKAPQEAFIEARLPSILWKDYFCPKNAQNIFILNKDISSIPVVPNGDDFIRQNNLYRFF